MHWAPILWQMNDGLWPWIGMLGLIKEGYWVHANSFSHDESNHEEVVLLTCLLLISKISSFFPNRLQLQTRKLLNKSFFGQSQTWCFSVFSTMKFVLLQIPVQCALCFLLRDHWGSNIRGSICLMVFQKCSKNRLYYVFFLPFTFRRPYISYTCLKGEKKIKRFLLAWVKFLLLVGQTTDFDVLQQGKIRKAVSLLSFGCLVAVTHCEC